MVFEVMMNNILDSIIKLSDKEKSNFIQEYYSINQ